MSDFGASLVRTVVMLIVGWAITFGAKHGFNIDSTTAQSYVLPIVTAVYYFIARFLELHVSPKFGWLLGLAKAPSYPAKAV